MTTQNTQTTPELKNNALVVGVVYSHNLEIKTGTTKRDNKDIPYTKIRGSITIQTAENESHKIAVDINQQTIKGETNKMFAGYQTLMNELITIEDLSNPEKQFPEGTMPSRLKVVGEINKNEYYNDAGLQVYQQIKPKFVPNRLSPADEFKPEAKFDVEGVIVSRKPEIIKEEETGRFLLQLMTPTFRNPIEIDVVTPAEYKDFIEEHFVPNKTVNVHGVIKNFSKRNVTVVQGGFGQPNEIETWESVRELQVAGGDIFEYDADSTVNKAYSPEQVQKLFADRATFLSQQQEYHKNKAPKNNSTAPTNSFGANAFGGAPTAQQKQADAQGVAKFF